MLLLILAGLANAECGLLGLQHAIEDGEVAFGEMEPDAFREAVNAANDTLGCLTDQITPVDAAGYHRLQALSAFFAEDSSATILHFQAVQGTQPGYELPQSIAPDGHPLRQDFEKAKQFSNNDTFELPKPDKGWISVDGRRTEDAPSGRPWLFQRLDPSGAVVTTAYQTVGAPAPDYPVFVEAPAEVEKSGGGGSKTPLKIAGIGLGAVGAGLYGSAFATRGAYNRAVEAGDRAKIDSAKGTTNALTLAGVGSLVAGGGLTVVGFIGGGG